MLKNNNNTRAFTFIELVISISILAILAILWFVSYSKNLEDSRDSQRESDLTAISNALKLHKTKRWSYPSPTDAFNIVNSGTIVAIQWKLSEKIIISTMDSIPLDPFINIPYTYSVWKNNSEFQISATLENNWMLKSTLKWDYSSPSRNIIPTIILAFAWKTDLEVNEFVWSWAYNRTKFIFHNSKHNIPYTFEEPYLPYADNTSFLQLITDPNIEYFQKIDYKNCNDIIKAEKSIWTWEYQLNSFWTIQTVNCWNYLFPKSCKEILDSNTWSLSGSYLIMPDWVNRSFTWYCDMSTASGWWTLMAKDGNSFDYSIGHCNFMNPPTNTTKESSFVYWACDLWQLEMLFWTPSWWVVWTNKVREDCSSRTSKTNHNTCSWTWSSQTFEITSYGGCMTGITTIENMKNVSNWLWWKWEDWWTGVTKNLSYLTTTLSWSCYWVEEQTSYCSLFDIYDNLTWSWIGQWWGYRAPLCWSYVDWWEHWAISPEEHRIFVR